MNPIPLKHLAVIVGALLAGSLASHLSMDIDKGALVTIAVGVLLGFTLPDLGEL